MKLNMFFFLLN